MATDQAEPGLLDRTSASSELGEDWRRLTRVATAVALITSPAPFVWFHSALGWSLSRSLIVTFLIVIAFRGLADLMVRRMIPWPSLYGTDDELLKEEDVIARRRVSFWRAVFRLVVFGFAVLTFIWLCRVIVPGGSTSWIDSTTAIYDSIKGFVEGQQLVGLLFSLPIFFLFNALIFLGPMMLIGVSQMRGFEPGDADWGVRLQDVRGQDEAKQEVSRVVTLWQSGEAFEKAGGKRERGLLFLGAPGTGKTMLAKAIATGFNCPFVLMPGSGFQQTFLGMDAVIVRWLARKAKKLARKWGGQCIVFIDEIDAVGMRRSALGGAPSSYTGGRLEDSLFYGKFGALNPTGDMILETRAWRDRLFAEREAKVDAPTGFARIFKQGAVPGMFGGGGQLALNQLLVVMDGIDNPPFFRRLFTNWTNTFLDATYFIPARAGRFSLRVPRPKPRKDQIYFIGATNVPLAQLDPALTRPGRMGRHVWLRTPQKHDRQDIFDLYIDKVAHEPDLDTDQKRDELARITSGYAQPLESGVLTPTGWKPMGDIEVDDEVIGSDGTPTKVVGVHPRGQMDVFRITFNDYTATECTADHLWTVEALDPRMLPRTFTLAKLLDRGLRWSPKGSRLYLPKLGAVQFEAHGDLPVDPYLLGLLLGDGGFTYGTVDFCTADAQNLSAVQELVPAGVSVSRHGPYNWRLSTGSRRGRPRSEANPLTHVLRDLALWGVNGKDKFVPDHYKFAGVEDRLALLQGLMDSDGTCDYRRGTGATFYSSSAGLADDVAFITRSLGGSARTRSKRDGWRVAVDLPEGFVPFRLSRKADGYRSSRRPFRKRIVGVEPLGPKTVQCVTVEAQNGLYVTDGFTVTHNSPAMIEQVCSMALTYAHADGRARFDYDDILEAMTTVESGTAVNIEYPEEDTRAVAVHESGHAAASHVYMKGTESTRISIRMRGESLGHHQAAEQVERFSQWRSDQMATLIWGLGAMAAERVFYGQTTSGVGGDIQTVTRLAALMVGAAGMGPEPLDLDEGLDGKEEERVLHRFEEIGLKLMNRTSSIQDHDVAASVLSDPDKRRIAAQILGQAYVTAHNFVKQNRQGVEKIADEVVVRREIYGDELLGLLEGAKLKPAKVDLLEEASWPML